jgi:hypothetical protein
VTPAEIVQAQLDAYNAQDIDALCQYYTEDVEVADLNEAPNLKGIEGYRERHLGLFATFPQNQAQLLSRIVVGSRVLDHERVYRTPESEPFEVVAIYSFRGERIARVDFLK